MMLFLQTLSLAAFLYVALAMTPFTSIVAADGLENLKPERLEAVRRSVATYRTQRTAIPQTGPFQEHRANLHVHSHWSHDSVGTVDEIVAAARATGTSVLMFSEHPADHYDFYVDGNQGVTGVEIYNTHADFKDEKNLVSALKNPFRMIQMAELIQKYPQECFAAIQNYPADYLKRWDELTQIAPHTGVSANDAHQNVGFVIRWTEGDKGRLEDALGEKGLEMDLSALPDIDALRKDKQPGDVIFSLFLDRYENSLRHVGTHLLLKDLSEQSVRECLDAGRAFVAFDWIADSTGFDFVANSETMRHEMGSQVTLSPGLVLKAIAPLPVHWRLIRDGEVISESDGSTLQSERRRLAHRVYVCSECGNGRAGCARL